MTDFLHNRVYEEIQIGQTAELQRTLTRDDIALFSKVSGDLNPTHVDEEYARARGAKGVVGHSLWATGLVAFWPMCSPDRVRFTEGRIRTSIVKWNSAIALPLGLRCWRSRPTKW